MEYQTAKGNEKGGVVYITGHRKTDGSKFGVSQIAFNGQEAEKIITKYTDKDLYAIVWDSGGRPLYAR